MQSHVDEQPNLFQSVVGYVGLLLRLERRLLALVVSYSLAIGLFSLIVPLTVQELTNTFAFAIQPRRIIASLDDPEFAVIREGGAGIADANLKCF